MSPCIALLAALLVSGAPGGGGGGRTGERVVLVPFENLTRAAGARETLMAAVAAGLERKGYTVVAGGDVEALLRASRIRYLDSLPSARSDELLAKTGADVVMVGSILTYDRKRQDPMVALALTAIASGGEVVWADVGGLAASQSRGAFDLERTSDVAVLGDRLVARMLEGVAPHQFARGSRRWWLLRQSPRVFRSPDVAHKPLTVAVLPLENLSGARDATRVVEAAILERLGRDALVKAIAPADLRQAVVTTGLRAPSRLTLTGLRKLAPAVGTSYFLQGTIFAYQAATSEIADGGQARVDVFLRLIDAQSGHTVWSGLHVRSGGDYEIALRFGTVRDPATLASRVVSELIDAFTRD